MHQLRFQLLQMTKSMQIELKQQGEKKEALYTLASSFDPGGKKGPHHPDSYLGYGATHLFGFSNSIFVGLEANASSTLSASKLSDRTRSNLSFINLQPYNMIRFRDMYVVHKESQCNSLQESQLSYFYICINLRRLSYIINVNIMSCNVLS